MESAADAPDRAKHSFKMFPIAFQENITRLLGPEGGARLLAALNDEAAPVSVRFNPLKGGAAAKAGLPVAEPVPWCADGFYLAERPQFTSDPLLHAGAYYVQEASSMFIAQAFKQIDFAPRRVLDLCAAPGGKSTLWRALLPDDALLVANEPIRPRANILAENLAKWGHPNVIVSNAYADGFAPLHSFFDVIAADVPCSGEGMFRKDRAAREEWTDGSPSACAARQWDIVSTVWPALRQGGYLVYSTCTFNREENEDIVWRIMKELGAEPVPIDCPAEWNIEGDLTGRGLPVNRFLPGRTRGEGLFLCLLRKTAEAPQPREGKADKKKGAAAAKAKADKALLALAGGWLSETEAFEIEADRDGNLRALPKSTAQDMRRVAAAVRTLSLGVPLAQPKGRDLIPCHSLALSTALRREAFPKFELSREDALRYLRREAVAPADASLRGYALATYQGFPLGFAKALAGRANNLYPKEWRIRTDYLQNT